MDSRISLEGRVAFVTGAGKSIGAACARLLAERGAKVAVSDIDLTGAEAVAAEIEAAGGAAIAVELDVRGPRAVEAAIDSVVAHWGKLDIGVNNAGISSTGAPIGEMSDEMWRDVLAVNLDGVFYCCRAEIAAMKANGGAIVNMASILSNAAFPTHNAYTASKHGVVGLTRGAALDHAADGIRVNAVAPGFIRTPLNDVLPAATLEALKSSHLLGRLGETEEVAEVVAWLASDAASFVTASVYGVDGGYLAV